ncbi:MAG: ABC transporter permease [Cyclobacteriaceae bacterium]
MIKQHLLTTLRGFKKQKSTFIINFIGLTTGLVSALLIFLWVQDERNVDQFHEDNGRIVRVMEHQRYANGDVFTTWSTPGILAAELKKQIPEVELASTGSWEFQRLISANEKHFKEQGIYADPDIFQIFTLPLVSGTLETALSDLNSIVISESFAKKLFPNEEPMNKLVKLDQEESYKISGIMKDLPKSSSMQFKYVMSAEKWRQENAWLRNWGSNGPRTYAKLAEGSSVEAVNDKISTFIKQRNEGSVIDLFVFPFSKTYLYGNFENGIQSGGRIEYVRLFSIIAIFILLIACINFMNLSTAKATKKAKEVGIRKAVGADRRSLIFQYLTESILITSISVAAALVLLPVILPYFNEITGKEIKLVYSPEFLLGLLAILLVTGIISGSYPALYLSSFQPVKVIKNEIKSSLGEIWARKGLVIFQFVLSIFLIVAVMVVYQQIDFIQNKNLGINKDNLIRFQLEGKLQEDHQAFFNELKKNPKIVDITATAHGFQGRSNNSSNISWPGKMDDEVVLFENLRSDYNTIQTLGVTLKEGRNFSREYATDSLAIIINETAAKLMRLDNPLGAVVEVGGDKCRIIGVAEDFNYQSLKEKVAPAIFYLSDYHNFAFVRIQSDGISATLDRLADVHSKFNPGFEFDYEFMDEAYARMYQSEERVSILSRYFAGFAVLISCLGLFGLAAFTAERRIKEVGIRKVLGASIPSLMMLLTKDFTRLVLAAILIALPLAFWITKNWLERFAFHIDLSIWFFAFAGALALFIAVLTVSSQAFKAASVNPAECLKDE